MPESHGTPLRLQGIEVKIQRAWKHLLYLEKEIAFWIYHKRYEVVSELEADGTQLVAKFQFLESPHVNLWGAVAGDVIHNARSALDHLAWQVVDANGGSVGSDIKFPIYKDEADYRGWRTPNPNRRRRDPFAGVDPRAIEAIEAEQPYAGEDGDPADHRLAVLNAMWNRDKHQIVTPTIFEFPALSKAPRFLTVTGGPPVSCQDFEIESGKEPDISPALGKIGKLKDRQHIATFFGKASGPNPKIHVHGDLTPEVCTEDGEIFTDTIRGLFIAAKDTVERLAVWITDGDPDRAG